MENKTYKLETIQDILNVVTKENLPYLIQDIANSLMFTVNCKEENLTPEPIIYWTDDKQTNFTPSFNVIDENGNVTDTFDMEVDIDKDLYDSIHDALVDIYNKPGVSMKEAYDISLQLSEDTLLDVTKYGASDTVVREAIYTEIKELKLTW